MKKIYSLAVALLFGSFAFAQTMYIDEVFTDVDVNSDVLYGTGLTEGGDQVQLFCDIYTPQGDNRTARPLLIMAHQGSFIPDYGDKTDVYLIDYAMEMAKRGYVVANINYREGWGFSPLNDAEANAREIIPASWRAIQDFKTAVRFFKKQSVEGGNPYGVSEALIIGGGFGAGGYLPINAMTIDIPSEINLEELQKKGGLFRNTPTGEPYIDTTLADLGGIKSTSGGHPGYSHVLPLVMNISGAVPTLKTLDQGYTPLLISVHSENDQATPYKTDVVQAAGVFPVIEVSGSFAIHEKLKSLGKNTYFENETRDGYSQVRVSTDTPSDNMYKNGLLTFADQPYMWSVNGNDTYTPEYQDAFTTYMDSVVGFTSYRLEKWIVENAPVSVAEVAKAEDSFTIYPNPAKDKLHFVNTADRNATQIEITDLTGKAVKTVVVNTGEVSIDITALPQGIYNVNVTYGDLSKTARFVKM